MRKIIAYLKRVYRLSLTYKKQEKMLWDDLKKHHKNQKFKSGIFEKDRYIESVFQISDNKSLAFYYSIFENKFICWVKVLDTFNEELTSNIFILATHFNNLLNYGNVIVNVDNNYVEYVLKTDILIPLLYDSEIENQMTRHYNTTKDIEKAFQRLINDLEEPAIIIAELLEESTNKV